MLKAVLHNGAIVPLEPLPADWEEGVPLEVAKADANQVDIDEWAKTMNQLCADCSPEDEVVMRRSIEVHRQQFKVQVRTVSEKPPGGLTLNSTCWTIH